MFSLDDEIWNALLGAFGTPYDPRAALERLVKEPQAPSLHEELGRQLLDEGKVGSASYAAVPHLLEAGFLSLALEIEKARFTPDNLQVPGWMRTDYERAWVRFLRDVRWHDLTVDAQECLLEIAASRKISGTGDLVAKLIEQHVH